VIETIAIARLLREAVQTPYRNLVTRPTGAAVRGRIESELADTGEWQAAVLDFAEVDLLDLSCADEVVAKLVRHAHQQDGRVVMLRGLHEDLCESVHEVLEHQQLAVVVVDGQEPRLLGAVAEDPRVVFSALSAASAVSAATLAGRLGWPEARAQAALDVLCALRLVRPRGDGFLRLPLA
jgi:hypothetical protein